MPLKNPDKSQRCPTCMLMGEITRCSKCGCVCCSSCIAVDGSDCIQCGPHGEIFRDIKKKFTKNK